MSCYSVRQDYPPGVVFLTVPPLADEVAIEPHPQHHLVLSDFQLFANLMCVKCYLILVLVSICLIINEDENFSFFLLLFFCYLYVSFCIMPLMSFIHFSIGLFLNLSCGFMGDICFFIYSGD